jgi:hypothetical protein
MTMTKNNKDVFQTADLSLAVALCVSGYVVAEMNRVSPTRSMFVFEDSAELQATMSGYWRGELRVEPQSFFNQMKILKARIYELCSPNRR